eukprot:TRINITY_DN622_c1_g2_i4.p5 TRINITY_DN622_c1_g2~~TRINITY_DN622_c1_g2_i4.p5  ORF type:complete len:113 (-),score=7.72 TRINITY_DN622_c1_g2_i4:577-915(-)
MGQLFEIYNCSKCMHMHFKGRSDDGTIQTVEISHLRELVPNSNSRTFEQLQFEQLQIRKSTVRKSTVRIVDCSKNSAAKICSNGSTVRNLQLFEMHAYAFQRQIGRWYHSNS